MHGKEVIEVYDEAMPYCKEEDKRYLGVGMAATLSEERCRSDKDMLWKYALEAKTFTNLINDDVINVL